LPRANALACDQSKSYNDLLEYKIARVRASKIYINARKSFETKLANGVKNNPKSFYAYVRSKLSVNDLVGPMRAKDVKLITDNGEMCNVLNDLFASVFTAETDLKELLEVKKGYMQDNFK
jgi:hypothetical protein